MQKNPQATLMVFRSRNRGMGLRPVNRIKHVVDIQDALVVGTQVNKNLIIADDAPVLSQSAQVMTGSVVNAIYLKVEAVATSSAELGNMYMAIVKNPGGNLGALAPNAVGVDDDKRFVIHQEMIMFQKQTGSNPRTLFNGVIKLPRGYRRFGPNDILQINLLSPGVTVDYCLQCHYKEFR